MAHMQHREGLVGTSLSIGEKMADYLRAACSIVLACRCLYCPRCSKGRPLRGVASICGQQGV